MVASFYFRELLFARPKKQTTGRLHPVVVGQVIFKGKNRFLTDAAVSGVLLSPAVCRRFPRGPLASACSFACGARCAARASSPAAALAKRRCDRDIATRCSLRNR